jgi:hypothetical protein
MERARAFKKNYSCCIYLSDNVCDPIDMECIEAYNKKNLRFHAIAFSVFIGVLLIIFIVSIVN